MTDHLNIHVAVPKTVDQPVGDTEIGPDLKLKAPVPKLRVTPLSAQESRSASPGLQASIQLTPCRSSQEIVAESN